MSAIARHLEVADLAIGSPFDGGSESNMGRLIDRLELCVWAEQPSFIGVIRLENPLLNSVKGKYGFSETNTASRPSL